MESQQVTQLFRQLFRHRPAGCLQNLRNLPQQNFNTNNHGGCAGSTSAGAIQTRSYATHGRASKDRGMKTNESRWQQRSSLFPADRTAEFAEYPQLSMQDLKVRSERPRRCKMLTRDFIDGTPFSLSLLFT